MHIENQLLCYSRLADEKQFEALANIDTGRRGGGPFQVYANTLKKYKNPSKFQTKDIRSRIIIYADIRRERNDQFDSGSVECVPKMT